MTMNRIITSKCLTFISDNPCLLEKKNKLKYSGSDISMIKAEIAFVIAWFTKFWNTTSRLGC